MTAPRVTSCPHCSTSFRVTRTQIHAANGAVRCGSCLQVFDARKNLDNSNKKAHKSAVRNSVNKPAAPAKEAQNPITTQSRPVPVEELRATKNEPISSNPDKESITGQSLSQIHGLYSLSDTDPIEISETIPKKSSWTLRLSSSLIVFFLSTLLGFQYIWFQRDTLSLNPDFRPAYNWLCQTLACKLPPLVNIDAIKSQQLLVRSHPEKSDTLLVDSVIANNANHPQPYPILHLSFADINGNLIASRAFTAREYLGGAMAGSKEMPIGQPIRLRLEIIDPGQEAVNYDLRFEVSR